MLLESRIQRPLTEGQYVGTIMPVTADSEVPAHVDETGKKINAYVKLQIVLDDGRIHNVSLFEQGLKYCVLNVADQLGISSAVLPSVSEVLSNAKIKFTINKNVVDDRTYYNTDFRPWEDVAPVDEELPFDMEIAR